MYWQVQPNPIEFSHLSVSGKKKKLNAHSCWCPCRDLSYMILRAKQRFLDSHYIFMLFEFSFILLLLDFFPQLDLAKGSSTRFTSFLNWFQEADSHPCNWKGQNVCLPLRSIMQFSAETQSVREHTHTRTHTKTFKSAEWKFIVRVNGILDSPNTALSS